MSVVGKSVGDTTPVTAYQPVSLVSPTTGAPVASPSVNADGSQDIAGVNGTSVATSANPFPISGKGSAAHATSQVTVGVTSTQIAAARTGRSQITVSNNGTGAFYVGVTGLTVANGFFVPGVAGASVTIPTQAAVFGIAPVAQSVSVLETF